MPTVYVRLDPRKLENPDLDMRYALPDLISAESGGAVKTDGYDYVGEAPFLLLFMTTEDINQGLLWVLSVLEHGKSFGNDFLRSTVVAVDRDGQKVVMHPKNFQGTLPV